MQRKSIIYLILFLIIILIGVWSLKFKGKKEELSFFEVRKGTVESVVSESGTFKKGDLINLSFETSGKIEKIFVKEGEKIKEGDLLVKLESSEIEIQAKMAKAQLAQAKASLEKLLSGPKEEEVELAEINLEKAKEDFKNFPSEVSSFFDYFYLKLKEVENQIEILKDKHFKDPFSDAQNFREEQYKIKEKIKEFETKKEEISLSNVKEKIEEAKEILNAIFSSLTEMKKIMKDSEDMRIITQQDLAVIDTQKETVNSLISSNLSLEKNYNLLKSNLDLKKKKLDLLTSQPKKEDIKIYQSKVREAEANFLLSEKKLEKTRLKSPVSGIVTEIFKEEGEMVEGIARDIVLQILPEKVPEIEVDIYEEDISKIKIGDPVEITFPAFEREVFSGKVVFIDPIEKIKDEVVYYGVKIKPENLKENIFPGMSCDLKIITQRKENVLVIPENVLRKKEGKYFVKVFEKGKIREKEIRVGLWGDEFVEILEGLKEGDKVLLP